MNPIEAKAHAAREASYRLAAVPTDVKNAVLRDLADLLIEHAGEIFQANAEDMTAARANQLPGPKLKRLEINDSVLNQMAVGLRQIAALPDPVRQVTRESQTAAGLLVRKVRVPIGVIAMIYESRPNVTIDAFGLCFKAGNACFLKGGKEAARSNAILARFARQALEQHGLPAAAVEVMTSSDRGEIKALLALDAYLDLVIPRGGNELIRFVHEHSRIPMVQHFHGVCHVYVDEHADLEKALAICVTAKTSAPATCNAAECILVHAEIAEAFVPQLCKQFHEAGVKVRGDASASGLADQIEPAGDDDWGREYLDLIVALRVVRDLPEAVAHIQRFGSNHTDAIVTESAEAAQAFINGVSSSCVLTNASTRFNDGFQLGLGAEIGISTSKIHAYGPMGLEELTTQRYVVQGDGQTR